MEGEDPTTVSSGVRPTEEGHCRPICKGSGRRLGRGRKGEMRRLVHSLLMRWPARKRGGVDVFRSVAASSYLGGSNQNLSDKHLLPARDPGDGVWCSTTGRREGLRQWERRRRGRARA